MRSFSCLFLLPTVIAAVSVASTPAATPTGAIRNFALTGDNDADAIAPGGCLTPEALASSHLRLQFSSDSITIYSGTIYQFDLYRAPSVFSTGASISNGQTLEELGLHAPVVYNSDGDTQAALTFACDASGNGVIKGLVTRGAEILELSTSDEEPLLQSGTATNTPGQHVAVVHDMSKAFEHEDVQADQLLYPPKSADPASIASAIFASSGPRKLAVARWTGCYNKDNQKRQLVVGIAIGSTLYKNRYGSSKQKTINAVTEMFAKTNLVYGGQLNINLKVGSLFIAPLESRSAPWDQQSKCDPHRLSINTQLDQFGKWAPKNTEEGGLWHLLDDCFQGSGTVGLAWVGTLCSARSGLHTGVSWYTSRHWLTFAHEIGHNFGGGHSFEKGQGRTGGIMDYGDGKLNGQYQFNSQFRKQEMCRTVKGVVDRCPGGFSVLNTAPTPPPAPTPAPTPLTGCGTNAGARVGKKCVFPFVHRGVTYNKCTTVDDPNNQAWCSTQTDSNNRHIKGNWGLCNDACSDRPTPTPAPEPVPTPAPEPVPTPAPPKPCELALKDLDHYKKDIAAANVEIQRLRKQINAIKAQSLRVGNRNLRVSGSQK